MWTALASKQQETGRKQRKKPISPYTAPKAIVSEQMKRDNQTGNPSGILHKT
jgi:hypothetical protein